jgi:hypothetical protein
MHAYVLTKPLQGATFRPMRAFLMNCSIDYYQDPLFEPISAPTLAPVQTPNPTTKSTSKTFIPTNDPTDLLMKPRFIQTDPSLWGCVETKSQSAKVPHPIGRPSARSTRSRREIWRGPWQDALFPRCLPHLPSWKTYTISGNCRTAKKKARP